MFTTTSEVYSKQPETEAETISKGNNDQERRLPHNDPIPMSYAYLLPILVNVGAIVPKQIEHVRFPYSRKHDHHAICGYHAGHVGSSIENCYPFKTKVEELINQLLCFTPVTTEAPTEKRFEYKGPPIHVQVPPHVVQPAMQYPNQGYHSEMPGAFPGESSSSVSHHYAYTEVSYVPFGFHYGQTSHRITSPSLVHSSQIFHPMVAPQIHSQLQASLVPMPYYPFPHGVMS